MEEDDDVGEKTVEYINALLEVLYHHQQFLISRGITKQEFEDYLNAVATQYSQTIHQEVKMTIEPTTIILAAMGTFTLYNTFKVWQLEQALDEVDDILCETIDSHNKLVTTLMEIGNEQD